MAAVSVDDAAVEVTSPTGTPRGTVLIVPGRGDAPAYYRRLATRLAADGYASRIAATPVPSVNDVAELWEGADLRGTVVLAVDAAAGLVATALAASLLDPAPVGVVFAGTAVPGVAVPAAADELSLRSACPVHRGVAATAAAPAIADAVTPTVWPEAPVRVPLLVLHGESDVVAPLDRVLPLYEGWDAEIVTVSGGLHDVLNDVNHRSVAAEVVGFLERLRADAAGPAILHRVRQR